MLFLRLLALVALCGVSSAAKEEPFQVKFDVVLAPGSYGLFTIECYPEWAPLGVAQFREIIETKIWTGARFFRVIPDFMVSNRNNYARASLLSDIVHNTYTFYTHTVPVFLGSMGHLGKNERRGRMG